MELFDKAHVISYICFIVTESLEYHDVSCEKVSASESHVLQAT